MSHMADLRSTLALRFTSCERSRKKRHEEMEHQNDHGDDAPAAVQSRAVKIKLIFFGLIAGPDDQELREVEIRPEHHESRGSSFPKS